MRIRESIEQILKDFDKSYCLYELEDQQPLFALAEKHNTICHPSEFANNEYIYIAGYDIIDKLSLAAMNSLVWEFGLKKVVLHRNHKSSNIGLIIVTNIVLPNAIPAIKSNKTHRLYRKGLRGISRYRLVVVELSSGNVYYNKYGKELASKCLCNKFQ